MTTFSKRHVRCDLCGKETAWVEGPLPGGWMLVRKVAHLCDECTNKAIRSVRQTIRHKVHSVEEVTTTLAALAEGFSVDVPPQAKEERR